MPGMEAFGTRPGRFTFRMSVEIPLTILNPYRSILVLPLRSATENGFIDLFVSGSHAIMRTPGEYILGLRGEDATRFFLEAFVDGGTDDREFSGVALGIHEMRNASARH